LAEHAGWLRSSVTLALAEADGVIDQFTDAEIQSLLEGQIADTLQGDTERLTELSKYGLNVMGQDMYNLLAKARTAGVLTEDGPLTQAMLAGRDLYQTLPNFTAEGSETNIALIAPAVQSAVPRGSAGERNSSDDAGDSALSGDGAVIFITDSVDAGGADVDYDQWIETLAVGQGVHKPAAEPVERAGLRSDGELVQAVSDADMGGDFIF